MASIIQHGQMSAPTQGGLFQGKRFWLSRQVPGRNNFIKQINVNGGEVVISEKDADMCIVDHLKDSANEGMLSYRYIEKSLKNEKLEDPESHKVVARKPKAGQRPKGSKSRNFFTQEDDEILMDTLSKTDHKLSGNKVYEEIAAKYPNHTMHSWRGRWIEHWSKLMPDGPRPLKKVNRRQEREPSIEVETKPQETELGENEIDLYNMRAKREMDRFTKEDEAILKEKAVQILNSHHPNTIYEKLSKEHPHHTPERWQYYFDKVMIPRIVRRSLNKQAGLDPKDNYSDTEDKGQPVDSINKDKVPPNIQLEVKMKPKPTSNSSDLKSRKPQPPTSTSSPIRTVSVRDRHPWSMIKEGSKQRVNHQENKNAVNYRSHQPLSPPWKSDPNVPNKTTTPKSPISAQQTNRRRAHTNIRGDIEDQYSELITSSPPKIQSSIAPNNQKRRRESSGFTPVQRKRSRNLYQMEEILSTPEPESSTQSRVLSPELGGDSVQGSSPAVENRNEKQNYATMSTQALYDQVDDEGSLRRDSVQGSSPAVNNRNEKQSYAAMSTQALYDQVDDEGSLAADMEFPELDLPSVLFSRPLAVPSPSPEPEPKPKPKPREKRTQSSKPPVTTTAPTQQSPLPPSAKEDPDGIEQLSTFLVHCQKEYKASERQVIHAIERTSGITALVEVVLQSIVEGKPLPVDIPGVWSEEDDKVLMGADSRDMKKLADLKGDEEMQRRMEFLNLWNMA